MYINKRKLLKIKRAANSCLEYFGTNNPFVIFQKLNIKLSIIHLEGKLCGFTNINKYSQQNMENSYHIYINASFYGQSQEIIAAHELGHVLLHNNDELNMFEKNQNSYEKEYEANIFTMELLSKIQPMFFDYLELSPAELQNYISSKIFI